MYMETGIPTRIFVKELKNKVRYKCQFKPVNPSLNHYFIIDVDNFHCLLSTTRGRDENAKLEENFRKRK